MTVENKNENATIEGIPNKMDIDGRRYGIVFSLEFIQLVATLLRLI